MSNNIEEKYQEWLENATFDENLLKELKDMDSAQKEDAFYRDLAFGTGSLRGVIGAETNRMNVYTVGKASQELSGLSKSDVLKFLLEGGSFAVVRPSGTEPKLKVYLSVSAADHEAAVLAEKAMTESLQTYFE